MTNIAFSSVDRTRLEAAVSFLVLAPRVLVPLGSLLAALLGATSCVPAARYEEAQSAAEVETEARRRALVALEAANARAAALEAELRARDGQIVARDHTLEQTKLARSVLEQERNESASMVEQLRSELSRAGDHLAAFSRDKTQLERELAEARAPGAGIDPLLALVARDAGLAVGAAKLDGAVTLGVRSDGLWLRVAADALFEPDRPDFRALAPAAFDAIARYVAREPRLAVSLVETDFDAAAPDAVARERRTRLETALATRGVAERVAFEPRAATDKGAPRAYELRLQAKPRDERALEATRAPE